MSKKLVPTEADREKLKQVDRKTWKPTQGLRKSFY